MVKPPLVSKNLSIYQGEASKIALCPQCSGTKHVRIEHSGDIEVCRFCRGEGVVEHRSHFQHFHPDTVTL